MQSQVKFVQPPHDYYYQSNDSPSVYYEDAKAAQGQSPNLSSVSLTSPLDLQFQLNRDVQNLHRTRFQVNINIPAQGANTFVWVNHRAPIAQIRFQSTRSAFPVYANYVQEYSQTMGRFPLSTKKLMEKTVQDVVAPSRSPATSLNSILPLAAGSNLASVDQTEPQYLLSAEGANLPLNWLFNEKLGNILPDSFFGIDCDWKFPEDFLLVIQLAPVNQWAWTSTNPGDPTAGAAALNNLPTLSVCRLVCQYQKNNRRVEGVTAFCKAGKSVPIPFLTTQATPILANAGSINQDFPIGTGFGTEVRQMVTTIWPSNRNLATSGDCTNILGSKISTYFTKLDSRPLQFGVLDCTASVAGQGAGNSNTTSDFDWNRRIGGESCLFQTRQVFQSHWQHIDDFRARIPVGDEAKGDVAPIMQLGGEVISGRSGANQIIYNFTATLPAVTVALVMLTFIVTTRTLVFHDDRLEVI
jgi:hypothetical protein